MGCWSWSYKIVDDKTFLKQGSVKNQWHHQPTLYILMLLDLEWVVSIEGGKAKKVTMASTIS